MSAPGRHSRGSSPRPTARRAKLTLEKVIGATVFSNAALALNQMSGELAFPAGCVTVVYDPISNRQTHFLYAAQKNSSKLKAVNSVVYSPNGRKLASAECGHQPSIFLWSLDGTSETLELQGHALGISTMAFTPSGKQLISVGIEHDQQLNVWDLRSTAPLRGCKVTAKIHAISVSEDGTSFVTAGLRHLRVWTLNDLQGHTVTCGAFRDHEFVGVVWGRGDQKNMIFAISREGVLFAFDAKNRVLSFWLELHSRSNALTLSGPYLVVACANGIVRLIDVATFTLVATLPRPNPIGEEFSSLEAAQRPHSHSDATNSDDALVYADAVAVAAFASEAGSSHSLKIAVFYNNRALFVWDVSNPKRIGKYRSFMSHSSCIWGIDMLPDNLDATTQTSKSTRLSSTSTTSSSLPSGTFATCSADGSIRFWNLDVPSENVYSKELYGAISLSSSPKEVYEGLVASGPVDGLGGSIVGSASANMALPSGVRALRISPDGKEVATGDRTGNVRIHRLSDFKLVSLKEAHEAEVLCLSYNQDASTFSAEKPLLLTSGSRDRLIHVFAKDPAFNESMVTKTRSKNSKDDAYELASTMDDHSASITGLAFSENGSSLFSSSSDKSIIFRTVSGDGKTVKRYNNMIVHGTIFDLKMVPGKPNWLVAAGQDRSKITIYDVSNGSIAKTIPTQSDSDILKLEIDQSGLLLVTASQDRLLRLYNLGTGEMLNSALGGHSELITGIRFASNGSRLISVSGDGCIFIWNVSSDLVSAMKARQSARFRRSTDDLVIKVSPSSSASGKPIAKDSKSASTSAIKITRSGAVPRTDSTTTQPNFREIVISPKYLPPWAHSVGKGDSESKAAAFTSSSSNTSQEPTGTVSNNKWASRVPPQGICVATSSEYASAHGPLIVSTANPSTSGTMKPDAQGKVKTKRLSRETDVQVPIASPSLSHSPKAVVTSDADDSTVYIPVDDTDIPSLGPIHKAADSPHASSLPDVRHPSPSPSRHEPESAEDHNAFFAKLQAETDFFHQQSFGNLNDAFVPTKSVVQGRKSISAKWFLKKPPVPVEPAPPSPIEAPSLNSSASSLPPASEPAPADPVVKKEQMAKDVERTKARLRELGITFGTKASPRAKSIVPASEKLRLYDSERLPSPVLTISTDHAPRQGSPIREKPMASAVQALMESPNRSRSMGDFPVLQPAPVDGEAPDFFDPEEADPESNTIYQAIEYEEAIPTENEADLDSNDAVPRPAFLSSLMTGFHNTVELYRELKENRQQDDLLNQFRAVYAEMKASLDILASEDPVLSTMASDRTYELTGSTTLECTEAVLLERYSETLVGLVRSKLGIN